MIRITPAAKRFIEALMQHHSNRLRDKFIPVLMWVIDDSQNENKVPYLTVGFIEEEQVDQDRWVATHDAQFRLAQHIPQDILDRSAIITVDVVKGNLSIIDS